LSGGVASSSNANTTVERDVLNQQLAFDLGAEPAAKP